MSTPLLDEIQFLKESVHGLLENCELHNSAGLHPDDLESLPWLLLQAIFRRIYFDPEMSRQIKSMQEQNTNE